MSIASRVGHAFPERLDRLVDHRHQDPVRDEARIVVADDRRLSHRRASASTESAVSSEVAIPRITSTSSMTGTGFMKCMPMKRSGRFVAAASRVIEIEEVFEAKIGAAVQIASSVPKSSFLTASFFDDRLDDEVGVREAREVGSSREPLQGADSSSGGALALCDLALEVSLDRGARLLRGRLIQVDEDPEIPAAAATCAMPVPIWPAPTTPSVADVHPATLLPRDGGIK